jgi:MFS family permease
MPTWRLSNRWAVLGLLFFARFWAAMQFQSIPPLAPFLMRDLALNYGQIGTLIGLFMFPGLFLALPAGLLSHRFGDKRVTATGLGALTAGAVLLAHADTFGAAFAARLVGGVGIVLTNLTTTKMTADWFAERDASTAMGILLSAWPLGIGLALSSLGWVATATSWQAGVYLTAAGSGLALLLVALLLPGRQGGADGDPGDKGAAEPKLWAISREELVLVLAAGMVWMVANVGYIVFLGFAPAFLIAGGMAVGGAGFLVSLASWVSIGSVPLGGWLTDRSGHVNALVVAGSLSTAATILLVVGGEAVAASVIVFGLLTGLWASAVMTLPGQALSPRGRGTGFGVFYTVFYGGMAVFPPVAGWLRDTTHSAPAPLLFAAAMVALTAPALGVFRLLQGRAGGSASGQAGTGLRA